MPLLKNRPLCTTCILFLFGIFLSVITDGAATIFVAVLSVFFFVLFLVLRKKRAHRKKAMTFLAVCAASLCFSQIFSFFAYFYPMQALPKNKEMFVTARVVEVEFSASYATEFYAELEEIDGSGFTGKVIVSCDFGQELLRGDRVSFYATAKASFLSLTSSERADGCIARLEDVRELSLLSHTPTIGDRLTERLLSLRAALSSRLTENVSGEGGALMSAMLLGEKGELSPYTTRDFKRLGMSHILAISGLHLQILVLLFSWVLARIGLRRRASLPFLVALILFYIALTGFSPSVVRAGVMALFLSLSQLVRERSDSMTSLFLAAVLITLLSPTTVYDIGFLLSCLATLGILTVSELKHKRRTSKIPRPLGVLLSSLLVTLAATLATLPVTALVFGEISLLSPLANLLLIPLFSLYLVCAIPALIFAPIPAVGGALSSLGGFLLEGVSFFAGLEGALIDIAYPDVILLALGGGALFFLLLCFARKRRTLAGAGAFLLFLFVCSLSVHTVLLQGRVEATYTVSRGSEVLLLCDGTDALLYDASGGKRAALSPTYTLLDGAHITELDGYFLSHYHDESAKTLSSLLGRVRVETVYLPTPTTHEENDLYRACLSVCEAGGASVARYGAYEKIEFGALSLMPHQAGVRSDGTHAAVGLTVTGGLRLSYLGAGMAESDQKEVAADIVAASDCLIFGVHGMTEYQRVLYPRYKNDLCAVIAPRAEERLDTALYAALTERGLLKTETTITLSLVGK